MAVRLIAVLVLLVVAAPAAAQLTDIQPGRNFPTSEIQFGDDRSENIDVGDVDNDGDYDVVVANGGDGAPQDNVIYINLGGIQAGTIGTFADQTATRFAGVPADTSRDVELVDFEDDGDLDVFICNRGNSVNGGEVSRMYQNQGGLQAGATGFFTETTDSGWGTLGSVPLTDEEGVQDGQGPFRNYCTDTDFADFDNDGDVDMFHNSPGLNFNGTEESRIFLNDGDGRFDELWPWADAAADVKLHTLDVDLFDIDADFDIDVFISSRDSQARVFRNNLSPGGAWAGDPFTDMTRTALLDTGAGINGTNNYELEYTDMDGDLDLDVWMVNYDGGGGGNLDRILRNNGDFTFTKVDWIRGDPNVDENEADFFDYDSDGDLDVFIGNFLGQNRIYQSGLAQGLDPDVDGLYHRTGSVLPGNLAPWPEVPTNIASSITLDGECADMDGDGDPDTLAANDVNQDNRYWENVRGVPDTHAPNIHRITTQGNKSDGTDTPIQAAVLDNAPYYIIGQYDARLVYSIGGGPEVCLRMLAQGGQQFRAVIPGGIDGEITYRVEVTDDAGNTGVSQSVVYGQMSSGVNIWESFDCGTAGVYGRPDLTASGSAPATIDLRDAAPSAACAMFLGVSSTPLPFKGGTLYVNPIIVNVALVTDAGGQLVFPIDLSAFPTGFPIWWQFAVQDAAAVGSVSISNALLFTAP